MKKAPIAAAILIGCAPATLPQVPKTPSVRQTVASPELRQVCLSSQNDLRTALDTPPSPEDKHRCRNIEFQENAVNVACGTLPYLIDTELRSRTKRELGSTLCILESVIGYEDLTLGTLECDQAQLDATAVLLHEINNGKCDLPAITRAQLEMERACGDETKLNPTTAKSAAEIKMQIDAAVQDCVKKGKAKSI